MDDRISLSLGRGDMKAVTTTKTGICPVVHVARCENSGGRSRCDQHARASAERRFPCERGSVAGTRMQRE